tara:strand:- start:1253 stop:2278 length:1026 start_codon:yes stop_codon:yes gene_type:complete
MYLIFRKLLFLFNPEKIHQFSFIIIKFICSVPIVRSILKLYFSHNNKQLNRNVFGINFPNPVGLAAGFDKDAKLINHLECFGFGFVEIGTVTPLPQKGNDKPRLFRLISDSGIINRMGFNNSGLDEVVLRLSKRKSKIIIGGNIGKNKITSNELAFKDYLISFNKLFNYVDYFVVNVSSPNTPNLRDLQEKEPLKKLLNFLQNNNDSKPKRKPILLKISPDLSNDQLDDIVEIIHLTKLDGVIATNTTIRRDGLLSSKDELDTIGSGGLSGKPLKDRSTDVIKYLSNRLNSKIPIIGVGGIHSAEDAIEKLEAGASLVQIYSGFIYEGPSLVKRINNLLLK